MKWIPPLLVAVVVLLHQDTWFWRSKALVLGFLPVGLFYHIVYTLLCAMTMWTLILYVWPQHLDDEAKPESSEASA
jgi:hypothetical protein